MTEFYKSYRIIDGKPKWVIVDENGDIVNRSPNKEELKSLGVLYENGRCNHITRHHTDEELLEFLRKYEREKGKEPTTRDFDNNPKYPCSSIYFRYFGSWNNALQKVGLEAKTGSGQIYTDKELLEFLRRFHRENGRSPREGDLYNNPRYPGPKTYQRRFDSWNNALKMAGLQISMFTDCTNEELLELLRRYDTENGRPPRVEDFIGDYPSFTMYKNRFGSWNNALKMAGLQVNVFTNCTNEDLLEYLVKFYGEKLRPPTIQDFIGSYKYPSFKIYQNRFGSWQKALRLVGLDVDSMVRKGVVETEQQKARQAEIHVLENDEKGAIDLSGENSGSFIDGISNISKGQTYDVKSSKLHQEKFWTFHLDKCVDFYYLLGYDKDYKHILYKWKIYGDFAEGSISIGNNNHYTYNIENMKEFEIK